MDRRLLGYLPPVLREVLEFQTIKAANEPEIVAAWDALNVVLANQFLEDARESGVAMWEQELKIHPKDTDTMEVRKDRIKAMWNLELPYTASWLRSWLDQICGAGAYRLEIDAYQIRFELDWESGDTMLKEAAEKMRQVCPANMVILLEQSVRTAAAYAYGVIGFTGIQMTYFTEVKNFGLE